MDKTRQLVLPDTYEDLLAELGEDYTKMSQFVIPVEEAEEELVLISQSIRMSGKIVMLLGLPGSGKSTFILSLTWRKHLPISRIVEIDANLSLGAEGGLLSKLYGDWSTSVSKSLRTKNQEQYRQLS
jgi:hypothetical protein